MPAIPDYAHFIARVEELGFMPLSHMLEGLPWLGSETFDSQWHTGDPETDPWRWKDRAAEDKLLAYGCILGGHKGFIAPRLYPLFYSAFHPAASMEERWEAGEVNQTVWQVWNLFQKNQLLDTSAIRKHMGVTASRGAGRVDSALRDLQRDFYLTIAGSQRKIGKDGQPYGWWINTLTSVHAWAPAPWLAPVDALDCLSAREQILYIGIHNSLKVNKESLRAALGW
jgi:hypothetical protein